MSSPAQSSQHKGLDDREVRLLEQAVEKLVLYGQQVGVTPEQMISLLDAGISIAGTVSVPSLEKIWRRLAGR